MGNRCVRLSEEPEDIKSIAKAQVKRIDDAIEALNIPQKYVQIATSDPTKRIPKSLSDDITSYLVHTWRKGYIVKPKNMELFIKVTRGFGMNLTKANNDREKLGFLSLFCSSKHMKLLRRREYNLQMITLLSQIEFEDEINVTDNLGERIII